MVVIYATPTTGRSRGWSNYAGKYSVRDLKMQQSAIDPYISIAKRLKDTDTCVREEIKQMSYQPLDPPQFDENGKRPTYLY